LQFEGQTKGKLGTPQAKTAVDNVVSEKLAYWLEENRDQSDMLVRKMMKAYLAREAARKAREEARKGKKTSKGENFFLVSSLQQTPKTLVLKSYILSKVILPEVLQNKDVTLTSKRFFHYVVRF